MTSNETKRSAASTTARHASESGNDHAAPTKPTAPTKSHQTAVRAATPATPSGPVAVPKREASTAEKPFTYEKRMRSLAPIVQVRRKVESTMKRFANLAAHVRGWKNAPDLREAAAKVETALAGMLVVATGSSEHHFHRNHRRPGGHRWCCGRIPPCTEYALRAGVTLAA